MTMERKSWEEFESTGLMWWVNKTLKLFGYAIVLDINSDDSVRDAYPAKVSFIQSVSGIDDAGLKKLSRYTAAEADRLNKAAMEG